VVRAPGTLESAATAALQGAYSRAGLGPWTQLADRGRRLQLLSVMGRDEEALANAELVASKQARGAPPRARLVLVQRLLSAAPPSSASGESR
jgi:hypothetical protein